jgi:hypothetical protein
MRKTFTALLMCLVAICCMLICNAKAQAAPPAAVQRAEVVQKLPDGDYVVRIEGVEYRAISASHERQLLEGTDGTDKLSEEIAPARAKAKDVGECAGREAASYYDENDPRQRAGRFHQPRAALGKLGLPASQTIAAVMRN